MVPTGATDRVIVVGGVPVVWAGSIVEVGNTDDEQCTVDIL